MHLNDNIHNAFHVVTKTYENIQKLLQFCATHCQTDSHYVQAVDKFLRFKSDQDVTGWLIRNFIVLFQDVNDPELENGWRDGPIYVLEIDLLSYQQQTTQQHPLVHISKYEYAAIESWTSGCSPANHWRFYNPRRNEDLLQIERTHNTLSAKAADIDGCDRHYWGIRTITSTSFPLVELTSDNAVHKIFGCFDRLA